MSETMRCENCGELVDKYSSHDRRLVGIKEDTDAPFFERRFRLHGGFTAFVCDPAKARAWHAKLAEARRPTSVPEHIAARIVAPWQPSVASRIARVFGLGEHRRALPSFVRRGPHWIDANTGERVSADIETQIERELELEAQREERRAYFDPRVPMRTRSDFGDI